VKLAKLAVAGTGSICGLVEDGSIHCGQSTLDGTSVAPEIAGARDIVGGAYYFCYIGADGDVGCLGSRYEDESRVLPDDTYAYATAHYFTCGLTVHGTLRCAAIEECCAGSDDYLPDAARDGVWVHADVGKVFSCAVGWPDGALSCWENPAEWSTSSTGGHFDPGSCAPPAGSFRQVSVGQFHACAITVDGDIECWGEASLGETDPPR
jgi:hypothetical protein